MAQGQTPEAPTPLPAAPRPAARLALGGGRAWGTEALYVVRPLQCRRVHSVGIHFSFPFAVFYFLKKERKESCFGLSSVRENLLGLGAFHFLSPRLSTSRAGPAPNRPAHRLHAGGTWACPLDRPWGALRGPNPVLVPICRAVAGGGGSPLRTSRRVPGAPPGLAESWGRGCLSFFVGP